MTGAQCVKSTATTEVEPLASLAGAAAFLWATSRMRTTVRHAALSVKEPIEEEANRHFQT